MERQHENPDQGSLIPAPSPKTSDSERAQLIKEWLFRFCLNAGVTPGAQELSGMVALHVDALADLSLQQLEAAYRKALNACKFWPVKIADIREHVDAARKNNLALEADAAWQKLLTWLRLHYQPDIPISRRAPQLDPATLHGANAAGGLHLIWGCPESDLVWRKKEFVADYTLIHETGKIEFLLADSDAKKLLADIRRGGPAEPTKILPEERQAPSITPSSAEQGEPHPKVAEKQPIVTKPIEQQREELRARGWIK